MEEEKVIEICSYCGEQKEVIPMKNSDKKICADCLIEMQDRIQGHYLPVPNNHKTVKEKLSCQHLVIAAIGF